MFLILAVLLVGFLFLAAGFYATWSKVVEVHIEIEAMKRSTHQVTFIDPLKQNFDNLNAEAREKMTRDPLETIM